MKKQVYIHLDGETATLKAHTGKMFAIGAIATLADYSLVPELDHKFYAYKIPHYSLWDSDTLQWAFKTYGPDNYISRAIDANEEEYDWRKIWTHLTGQLDEWLSSFTRNGYTLNIICNHTNFDVTFLQTMYEKLSRKFPFNHQRVWDMPSMLVASSRMPLDACYTSMNVGRNTAAHLALDDAIRQAGLMQKHNVYLPE